MLAFTEKGDILSLIRDAEENDRPRQIEKTEATLLAWGLTTRYAGPAEMRQPLRKALTDSS